MASYVHCASHALNTGSSVSDIRNTFGNVREVTAYRQTDMSQQHCHQHCVKSTIKRAVWYPFLDCTLQSLQDKFSSHQLMLLKLVALMPSHRAFVSVN